MLECTRGADPECREIEAVLPDDSVLVADGGDFVGSASYIVSPRGPLSWLDPETAKAVAERVDELAVRARACGDTCQPEEIARDLADVLRDLP